MNTEKNLPYLSSDEIRAKFLSFFKAQGHEVVPSGSLIPYEDNTLLFTNAGMVPFKDVFLGKDIRSYSRASSSQRCVRAGGKHNDLEQVGYTARHHTFFEMLGNFSFGDYFKREAIFFAWEFLTRVLCLPEEKLWITVFEEDDEAAAIWLNEVKINPERFSRCGEKDNFWSMGDTGPCGPCTEIFYDHGASIFGGPPGSPDADADRYIEIWNLVFMQFDRLPDGQLVPLPKPSVDTGMGLERLTAVLQGVHNNYETDLFMPILVAIADIAKIPQGLLSQKTCTPLESSQLTSMRVIADHIRSSVFLIHDGVIPSNEGRGYVLRRIIRRAIRHGHKLGIQTIFFDQLVPVLVDKMRHAYPELEKSRATIEKILHQEEAQFLKTLDQGLKILEQSLSTLSDKKISGDLIFKLYDTFGFPPDLTGDIARERGYTLDMDGFTQAMEKQRAQSQAAGQFHANYHALPPISDMTTFIGYDHKNLHYPIKLGMIIVDGQPVKTLDVPQSAALIFEEASPFYPEGGGQVGDQGVLRAEGIEFIVHDTRKQGKAIVHIGELTCGTLYKGQALEARVDQLARQQTARNHSATHLLHAALRQILGSHVEQKGSLVSPLKLRFDFLHSKPLTMNEIQQIEALMNEKIWENIPVETCHMTPEKAIESGAMALFGEKYEAEVRVLSIGAFSKELCGGTHVAYTSDIGLCKIISETGVAAGIRRIEALTGQAAYEYLTGHSEQLRLIANQLKTTQDSAVEKFTQCMLQLKEQERKIAALEQKLASAQGGDLVASAEAIAGIKVLIHQVDNVDIKVLRQLLDQLKNQLNEGIILLTSVNTENRAVTLLAGVTKPLYEKISANDLIRHLAEFMDGKGGGRADMAQGGSHFPEKLDVAKLEAKTWIKTHLAQG